MELEEKTLRDNCAFSCFVFLVLALVVGRGGAEIL
jgi:hypothetical protein